MHSIELLYLQMRRRLYEDKQH